MNWFGKLLLTMAAIGAVVVVVKYVIPVYHYEAWLDTMNYYKYYGYPAQNYYVTTVDGYIL